VRLLIVAATDLEIDALRQSQASQRAEISFLATGVGVIHSVYALMSFVHEHSIEGVINMGVAGTYDHAATLGEVVEVHKDRLGDLGTPIDNDYLDIFDLGLDEAQAFPFEAGWLVNRTPLFQSGLRKVRSLTVNTMGADPVVIQRRVVKYKPDIETLEGAAIAYCCARESLPFIQIRAISNHVQQRDRDSWQLDLAIENLNAYLGGKLIGGLRAAPP
jgi:futalosine hydrolase